MVPQQIDGGRPSALNPKIIQAHDGKAITLRMCEGLDELDACVRLQVETWGYSGGDVIPRRMFIVARRIGGQVVGAFDPNNHMIGFAMSFPGLKQGTKTAGPPLAYLHSHMLAVLPPYRNSGIGRALKLYQRKEAIGRGISLMEWTFDPLEIKNAHLNIHKLGVIVRSYTPDFYGVSSSRLQAGLPTDRLHAEWWMESERVKAILEGSPHSSPEIQVTITVPNTVSEWKARSVSNAQAAQSDIRQRFLDAFSRGLVVVGFRVDSQGNGDYELARLKTGPKSL